MALQRCLLELGTGVDLHGRDSTKAARRAVFDALRHCSVAFQRVFGHDVMFGDVTIGVPHHDTVRPEEVLEELPYGIKSITVIEGGLEIPSAGSGGDSTLIANAAIIVSLDVE